MPGVTSKNIFALMNRVQSVAELVTLTEHELQTILDSESHAKQLYRFLHSDHQQREMETVSGRPSSVAGTKSKTRKPKFFKKGAKGR